MTDSQASTSHPKTRRLPTVEERIDTSIEEQVQTMIETQKEILRLLQTQMSTSAQQGRSLSPQQEIPNDNAYEEFPLQVHYHQRYDDDFFDTASTTHPSRQHAKGHKSRPEPTNQPPQKRRSDHSRNRYSLSRPTCRQRDPRSKNKYTPLNTSRTNILMNIQGKNILKWPHPLKPHIGNQEQYCHYHRSRGHNTENCILLKKEIERLIHQGYLGRFIRSQTSRQNNSHTRKLSTLEQ